jgi:hypothetical protein
LLRLEGAAPSSSSPARLRASAAAANSARMSSLRQDQQGTAQCM